MRFNSVLVRQFSDCIGLKSLDACPFNLLCSHCFTDLSVIITFNYWKTLGLFLFWKTYGIFRILFSWKWLFTWTKLILFPRKFFIRKHGNQKTCSNRLFPKVVLRKWKTEFLVFLTTIWKNWFHCVTNSV